jgi:hypothetical protein
MASQAIVPVADAGVAAAIRSGEKLVARATAPGLAFALDELGDIVVPDTVSGHVDKAQLRALASLYLSADLESAGVIPAVEALANFSAGGAASLDLGATEPLVAAWWRHRAEKLSAVERAAFYSRLFGTAAGATAADASRNTGFEDCMLALCEALYKLDDTQTSDPHGDLAHQARVRSAASGLAQNLGEASTGVTAYMASEILGMLKEAFAILGHADLRHALGARDLWGVVAGIDRLSHRQSQQPTAYVRRGKAGMTVIAWLADLVDGLAGTGPLLTTDSPVIAAAADWIEATLSLGESAGAAPAPAPAPAPSRRDFAWAALGR